MSDPDRCPEGRPDPSRPRRGEEGPPGPGSEPDPGAGERTTPAWRSTGHEDPDPSVGLIRFWYRRHAGRVYRYARWRTGRRETAEAVVSDVFLEAWRSADDYDPERGSVESWLLGIARNVVRRERSRREREAEPHDPSDLEALAAPGPTPEDEALRGERRERLLSAVWELPREDRDLVALVYGAGLSRRRIAELLETTPGAVRTRLHRLLRRLREELGDD